MATTRNISERSASSESRGVILFQGIAAIVLGVLLMSAPGASLALLVTFLGMYWLLSGVVGITKIFSGTASRNWFWAAIVGALGIFAGLIVLQHPLWSAILVPAALVVVMGINALLMSAVNLIRALSGEGVGHIAIAILDFAFGAILLGSPLIAATALPVVLGFFALISGFSMIILAFTVRREMRKEEPAERETRRAA